MIASSPTHSSIPRCKRAGSSAPTCCRTDASGCRRQLPLEGGLLHAWTSTTTSQAVCPQRMGPGSISYFCNVRGHVEDRWRRSARQSTMPRYFFGGVSTPTPTPNLPVADQRLRCAELSAGPHSHADRWRPSPDEKLTLGARGYISSKCYNGADQCSNVPGAARTAIPMIRTSRLRAARPLRELQVQRRRSSWAPMSPTCSIEVYTPALSTTSPRAPSATVQPGGRHRSRTHVPPDHEGAILSVFARNVGTR